MSKTAAPLTLNEAIHQVKLAINSLYVQLPETVAQAIQIKAYDLIHTIEERERFQVQALNRMRYQLENAANLSEQKGGATDPILTMRRIAQELLTMVGPEPAPSLKTPDHL